MIQLAKVFFFYYLVCITLKTLYMKKLILTSIALVAFTGFTFAKTVNQNSETENSDSKNQSITMTYTKEIVTDSNEKSDFGFVIKYLLSNLITH